MNQEDMFKDIIETFFRHGPINTELNIELESVELSIANINGIVYFVDGIENKPAFYLHNYGFEPDGSGFMICGQRVIMPDVETYDKIFSYESVLSVSIRRF